METLVPLAAAHPILPLTPPQHPGVQLSPPLCMGKLRLKAGYSQVTWLVDVSEGLDPGV